MFKKGQSGNPLGKGINNAPLEEFRKLTREQRYQLLREEWAELSYTILMRAKSFAKVCSPQEFGRLYQAIMSGAVSIDKAFPPKEVQQPQIQVNMFGSLGQRAREIVVPKLPQVLTIEAKEINETITSGTSRPTDGAMYITGDGTGISAVVSDSTGSPQDQPPTS